MRPIETSKRYHSCAGSLDTSTRIARVAMQAEAILYGWQDPQRPNRSQANVGKMSEQWTNP